MKDGMKVIGLSGYFLLPEGFDGDVAAALTEIANYHNKARKGETGVPRANEPTGVAVPNETWEGFCAAVNEGKKLHMAVSLVEWNEATGKWEFTDSFKEEVKEAGGSE